jgi:putative phosphoesterase
MTSHEIEKTLKLYVISDTHGQVDQAIEIYNQLCNIGHIDHIIHLGDMERDGRKISERTGKTVISVRGNNEPSSSIPGFRVLKTAYGDILLTHGHLYKVKLGLQNLLYKAEELGCVAAFFGHTHRPLNKKISGIHLLNPGSLTFPPFEQQGSYAVVTISENEFSPSIFYREKN